MTATESGSNTITLTGEEEWQSFVAGTWQSGAEAGTIRKVNPATGEEEGSWATPVTGDQVEVAVIAARALHARGDWRNNRERRVAVLEHALATLRSYESLATELITREVGSPYDWCRAEQVGRPIRTLELAIEALRLGYGSGEEQRVMRYGDGGQVPNPSVPRSTWLERRDPVGPVLAITPWNYPLHQSVGKVAWAFVAGCPVVLKPSELTPATGWLLARMFECEELPVGALSVLQGHGQTGDYLARQEGFALASFTGSVRAGRSVAEWSARLIRRSVLELGGKSPSLVLHGADLEAATRWTIENCFENAGQTCCATSRLLVPRHLLTRTEELAAEMVREHVTAQPYLPETTIGPLITHEAYRNVRGAIADAIDRGATVVGTGRQDPALMSGGFYVRGHVLTDVERTSRLANDEVFGPVLAILPYDAPDDAVRLANATRYGLAAAVWHGEGEGDVAMHLARQVRAGQVWMNGVLPGLEAPFGGEGESGYGRENGLAGLAEYQTVKVISR